MLDRCPTCGKTMGRLMESHLDEPGVIEILSGERRALESSSTPALCVLLVLAAVATEAPFRSGVSIDRCSLLRADSTPGSSKDVLTRLIFV